MPRWEDGSKARLELAALELFAEQGYDRTSVAQIARRAGLTERSFYRWFADKREVLFADEEALATQLAEAVAAAADGAGALTILFEVLGRAPVVGRPRGWLSARAAVIAANPPLRERELIKLAATSDALGAALVRRGHDEHSARLATDLAMAVLRLATRRWLEGGGATFFEVWSTSAEELLAVVADGVENLVPRGRPARR